VYLKQAQKKKYRLKQLNVRHKDKANFLFEKIIEKNL